MGCTLTCMMAGSCFSALVEPHSRHQRLRMTIWYVRLTDLAVHIYLERAASDKANTTFSEQRTCWARLQTQQRSLRCKVLRSLPDGLHRGSMMLKPEAMASSAWSRKLLSLPQLFDSRDGTGYQTTASRHLKSRLKWSRTFLQAFC